VSERGASPQAAPKRRPGRPRSAEAEQAILGAALGLAAETGLSRMTMEGVASRAGVGKATIYRRWDSKEALFADALRSVAADMELPPDSGSFRIDWLHIIGQEFERITTSGLTILPRLMSESAHDPPLHRLLLERMVSPRRTIAAELIRRGIARGELRADLDVELTIDLLVGPLIYRALLAGPDLDAVRGMSERVLDLALAGLAAH
jgi:AcrR family transcriptional regulator